MSAGGEPVALAEAKVAPPDSGPFARLHILGFALAAVGLGGSVATAGGDGEAFYRSYLVAFLFWLTLALGGLVFVLIQFASRAGWSVVVRRVAEHVMATLPAFAVLVIPILLGLHDLFHWSHADALAHDPLLQHKQPYLNETFFLIRAVVYVLVWTYLAWWFRKVSLAQDSSGDPQLTRKLQRWSPLALIAFALTTTFASFDWIMSLDPHWYSTIFGVYIFGGCMIAICALLILLILGLQRRGRLQGVVTFEHLHDLGKLLFAFVVFWAYIAFSQFMLIWYGNIPEETLWYQHRLEHGWEYLSWALMIGHFALPFLVLLLRGVKRRGWPLALGALWLLVMHYLDIYWLVMPSFKGAHFHLTPLDLTLFVGIGGVFFGCLGLSMRRRALVPVKDPRLAESLAFENF